MKSKLIKGIFISIFLLPRIFGYELHTADIWSDPGVTQEITAVGSEVQFTYGVCDSLSLIGTEFSLALTGQPKTAEDFCEARSAGGAGIQYSHGMGSTTYGWINNQAAGNAIGYQWGFKGKINYCDSSDTLSFIKGAEWLPAYFDTYDEDGQGPVETIAVSPVEGNSSYVHYIKSNAVVKTKKDGQGGEIISLALETLCKWAYDTTLGFSTRCNAFYMRRDLGRDYNMEIHFQGRDKKTDKQWFVGPIKFYENWDIAELRDQYGIERGKMLEVAPGFGGCWSMMDKDINGFTIVIKVGDKRVACGVKNIENDVTFGMAETVYPPWDKRKDECGSVNVAIRQPGKLAPNYKKGQITEHKIVMEIGTVEQLRNFGYWIPEQMEIVQEQKQKPDRFALSDNYPNPFNPITKIDFELPERTDVMIQVYDLQGHLIEKSIYRNLSAGRHSHTFVAYNLSSGIYFYKMQARDFTEVKKMSLIK